ncbi:hypothetical protein LTR62_003861 [Meristemomyces frigidus]|uniref:MYND-type domain-containing protein n=1 Tax=Meristemomyces frigidus TaxID=1508187 RepID=A0AAN7YGJ4_9PEZI|nr:hypothetical protein LTR62_003861 [Meristemomyces frigidus]
MPDLVAMLKGVPGPLRHRCSQCDKTSSDLFRCSACQGVRYCTPQHQTEHWSVHESACRRIKQATKLLEFTTPGKSIGYAWGVMSTRDYMRARLELSRQLANLNTLDGVMQSYQHRREMLTLCRSDQLGLRIILPAIMLRLDLDLECYHFVKWWSTYDAVGQYDMGHNSWPCLHVTAHAADAFEDPSFLLGTFPELNHLVAVFLLKLKLLMDVVTTKVARKVLAHCGLIRDLHQDIESGVVRSPLSAQLCRKDANALHQMETKLSGQIQRIAAKIALTNSNFFVYLFNPDKALTTTPEAYSSGSWDEMALAIQFSYATFWETEGLLPLLNNARACAARGFGSDIRDTMESSASKASKDGHRTVNGSLKDASISRMWDYLTYAVTDASFLGPWSKRPSKRYFRRAASGV